MDTMIPLIPSRLYLAAGVGTAKENKNARDHASAGILLANLNLVNVSSVLPAGIRQIDGDTFRAAVTPGTGYVAELYEWPGIEDAEAVRRTEQMVIRLYAERQGSGPFDPTSVWEPGRTVYSLAGREVEVRTIQASGVVPASGDWTCALAAAVLL
jgi:pyruvoyl-dependent arginine decarboxylase (PvlArgDC)